MLDGTRTTSKEAPGHRLTHIHSIDQRGLEPDERRDRRTFDARSLSFLSSSTRDREWPSIFKACH